VDARPIEPPIAIVAGSFGKVPTNPRCRERSVRFGEKSVALEIAAGDFARPAGHRLNAISLLAAP
jgi:hypothetical protein